MDGRKYRRPETLKKLAESGRKYRGANAFHVGANYNREKRKAQEERIEAVVESAQVVDEAQSADIFEEHRFYVSRHAVRVGCVEEERAPVVEPPVLTNVSWRRVSMNPKRERWITNKRLDQARAEDPYVLYYVSNAQLRGILSGAGKFAPR